LRLLGSRGLARRLALHVLPGRRSSFGGLVHCGGRWMLLAPRLIRRRWVNVS
jgi:hypothetical protein